eukprot:scaffold243671_cov35-Tisochrysis_lutea.AAC.2
MICHTILTYHLNHTLPVGKDRGERLVGEEDEWTVNGPPSMRPAPALELLALSARRESAVAIRPGSGASVPEFRCSIVGGK